jgi:outer membrane lipoprotein LolB
MAAAAAVAACAVLPPPPIPLEGLPSAFEMGGRLSVAQSGRGEILRIRWSHGPGTDTWVIATPVGTEVARIERAPGAVVVLRPGEVPMEAASFADLTDNLLGAPLDERLLVAWIHGRPAPGPDGWEVTVDGTQRFGVVEVARRVTASRGETVVRIVVDDYRAGSP